MFRIILCTAALTIAATAANADAGKFSFGGGGNHGGHNHSNHNHNNHSNHHHHNNHHQHNYHHNHHNHHNHYVAPVVRCYYQVCFYNADWAYKQHKVFNYLHEAQAYAHSLQLHGYYASVSKTHSPYYGGPRLIVPHHHAPVVHNAWLP
jgi:hypothetical protein